MMKEKNLIGKAAAALVHDGDTIMIEAGTTIAAFSKHLLGKQDIKLVTHSTLVLPYARINPHIHLTIVGGYYNPQSETFLGPLAIAQLEQFFVKMAFIGCDGFSIEEGLSGHSAEAAEVTKKMAERSDRTILLADSSKYNKKGFALFLPFSKVDSLITDSGIDTGSVKQIEEQGCKVLIV
jgi:DeoR/GlpR family transcriptional regulator of sugar metabolism